MRTLRACWRLARMIVHGLHGLAIVWLVLPGATPAQRQARVRWWSTKLLKVMGLELQVQGRFRPGAKLIVANHISWLDIMAVHSVCPEARFVSKADVQAWPLVGRLVDAGGTLYIQREKRRDALRVVHEMAAALKAGDTVAVFPEGTTADGHALLPFHANLLQAAIATETPIQPVALRFSDRHDTVSRAAQYIGETTLAQSMWRLAMGDGVRVTVAVLPPQASAHADRRALAEYLREQIGSTLAGL